MTPAALQRRVAAFLIDQVLLFGVVIGLSLALGVRRGEADDESNTIAAVGLVGLVLVIAYHTVAVARYGRTVGKHVMGLRVVSLPVGAGVLWTYAALRALIPAAVVLLPVVGNVAGLGVYLWAVFDPRRQGLHDKLAGTMVVPAGGPVEVPPT